VIERNRRFRIVLVEPLDDQGGPLLFPQDCARLQTKTSL
jgi:hypothetical protein